MGILEFWGQTLRHAQDRKGEKGEDEEAEVNDYYNEVKDSKSISMAVSVATMILQMQMTGVSQLILQTLNQRVLFCKFWDSSIVRESKEKKRKEKRE